MSEAPRLSETTDLPRLGRYQFLEKLGEGGMGQVFLAHDQRLDRRVAIKVLPDGSINDPGAIARFQREAKALAQLSHPGIIQAYDSEEADGRHFLVMEFVEGQSLAALLKEKGRLAPAVAADYVHQAALALQHAHEKGLVHRDVKPLNLLLAAGGRVKVLDLGLARFLQDQVADPARTREGAGMGTPDYAAPEQFRDAHAADARADIYALGCTLFHLLTGQVPFPGSSLSEKYEAHAHKAPPLVEELCPDVPGGLTLAVQKMIAKRPADRFQSAAEVAEALAPFVASSSASFQSIRNTSEWEGGRLTLTNWRTRRRRLVTWAVVGAFLAVAVLSGMFRARSFGPERERKEDQPVVENKGQAHPGDGGGKKEEPSPPALLPDDPNVLTVSQTKEEGGGTYRTINAALAKARAGQTIRVLDAKVYPEVLRLSGQEHAGLTLEAVRGATLETPPVTDSLIEIDGLPDVTLRGFRLLAAPGLKARNGFVITLVAVKDVCPRLRLERLVVEGNGGMVNGVEVTNASNSEKFGDPVLIRDCTFHRLHIGVAVNGLTPDSRRPRPVGHVVVRGNDLVNSEKGILVRGAVRHVQVVGNRVWNAGTCGLELEALVPGAADILIANNTVFESRFAFRLFDEKARGENVRICNNLFLASKTADMIFADNRRKPSADPVAGDGQTVSGAWKMYANAREGKPRIAAEELLKAWIPATKDDLKLSRLDDVERNVDDLANFLRPAKGSPLATQGAGQTDPSLPSYVGALPPADIAPWDWDRTWRSRASRAGPEKERGKP